MAIITDNKPAPEDSDVAHSRTQSSDNPPPYLIKTDAAGASATGIFPNNSQSVLPAVPDIAPTNFLNITRARNSVKGEYVINVNLQVPKCLLASDDDEETQRQSEIGQPFDRPNLKLVSHTGSVAADVWIIGRSDEESIRNRKRVVIELELKTSHDSIRGRVISDYKATPFTLSVVSSFVSISIAIPRSFIGPVTMSTTYGSIKLSKSVEAALSMFSNVKDKRIGFIGDQVKEGYGEGEWTGSSLEMITSHRCVTIEYVDEQEEEARKRAANPGFWSRLFNNGHA